MKNKRKALIVAVLSATLAVVALSIAGWAYFRADNWRAYEGGDLAIKFSYPSYMNLVDSPEGEGEAVQVHLRLGSVQDPLEGSLLIGALEGTAAEAVADMEQSSGLIPTDYAEFSSPRNVTVGGKSAIRIDAVLKTKFTNLDSDVYETAIYLDHAGKAFSIVTFINSKNKANQPSFPDDMEKVFDSIEFAD